MEGILNGLGQTIQYQSEGNPIVALLSGTIGLAMWVGIYVVMALALMTIAKKTGTANEWWAWVPILNILLMLQIADLPMWYIILFFVPCVNLGVGIYAWWKIAEKRGKPGPVALAILIPCVGWFVPLYIAFAD